MRVSPVNLSYSNSLNESRKNKVTKNVPQYNSYFTNTPQQNVSFCGLWKSIIKLAKEVSGYDDALTKLTESSTIQKNIDIFVDKIDGTLNRENILNKSGKIKGFIEYHDSNAGPKIQRKVELNPDDTVKTITTYEYVPNSPHNYISRTFNFDGQGRMQWETRYKYNEGKQLSETSNYDPEGNFIQKTAYWPLFGIKEDYNESGVLLKRMRTSLRDGVGNITEIVDYNPSSPYYGRTQVIDDDFNLIETIRYEKVPNSYSDIREFRYYPSGKLKSVANCDGNCEFSYNSWNKREFYESGKLKSDEYSGTYKEYYENGNIKVHSRDSGNQYETYYENGNLMEKKYAATYYSGTHTYIADIDITKYAPDGKTVIVRSTSCPNDPWIPDINEREHTVEYSPDGKTIKKIYHKLFEKYGNTHEEYTVKYKDNGDLSAIYIGKFFYPASPPDFRDGDDINKCSYQVQKIYNEYKDMNKK